MNEIAIRVENLSKRYRIGAQAEQHDTFVGAIMHRLRNPMQNLQRLNRLTRFGKNGQLFDEADIIWALKDVSFEVARGEVVGLIGRNGAGKSTLLKILSRITYPTNGRFELFGRVSSLLEVGTGFHPELTGRENIYLNGTILGMTKREIDRKFEEIVDFSGIEKFIDTPVKRYSSGMGVRLAFSVAAHLEPEILLVDEVLAVGDAEFQKRCLGKMREVAQHGRSVIFISHNMAAIRALCTHGIYIENGQIFSSGKVEDVINHYLNPQNRKSITTLREWQPRRGNEALKFIGFEVQAENGGSIDKIMSGQSVRICLHYEAHNAKNLFNGTAAITFRNAWGQAATTFWTELTNESPRVLQPKGTFVCHVPQFPLIPGAYTASLSAKVNEDLADSIDDAVSIQVISGDFFGTGKPLKNSLGVCLTPHSWSVEEVE